MESTNVKFDEYIERNEVECKIEPKDYISFIYVNDSAPITPPN